MKKIQKKRKGKKYAFELNNVYGVGIMVLLLGALLVVPVAKANLSFLDTVALKAGEVFGLNLASRVDVGELTEQVLGAFPGGDIFSNVNVFGTFSFGGGKNIATSTTATSYTLVYKDLAEYSLIELTVNTDATTITWPATSTMRQLLPQIGSTRTWLIHNATTSSSITLTNAAGTGMDLIAVTVNDDVIDPEEYTRITCTRIPYNSTNNEEFVCIADELADAD